MIAPGHKILASDVLDIQTGVLKNRLWLLEITADNSGSKPHTADKIISDTFSDADGFNNTIDTCSYDNIRLNNSSLEIGVEIDYRDIIYDSSRTISVNGQVSKIFFGTIGLGNPTTIGVTTCSGNLNFTPSNSYAEFDINNFTESVVITVNNQNSSNLLFITNYPVIKYIVDNSSVDLVNTGPTAGYKLVATKDNINVTADTLAFISTASGSWEVDIKLKVYYSDGTTDEFDYSYTQNNMDIHKYLLKNIEISKIEYYARKHYDNDDSESFQYGILVLYNRNLPFVGKFKTNNFTFDNPIGQVLVYEDVENNSGKDLKVEVYDANDNLLGSGKPGEAIQLSNSVSELYLKFYLYTDNTGGNTDKLYGYSVAFWEAES